MVRGLGCLLGPILSFRYCSTRMCEGLGLSFFNIFCGNVKLQKSHKNSKCHTFDSFWVDVYTCLHQCLHHVYTVVYTKTLFRYGTDCNSMIFLVRKTTGSSRIVKCRQEGIETCSWRNHSSSSSMLSAYWNSGTCGCFSHHDCDEFMSGEDLL